MNAGSLDASSPSSTPPVTSQVSAEVTDGHVATHRLVDELTARHLQASHRGDK